MKKTAIVLMIITIISKLLGLLKDIILSYYYGTSNISDAYLISLTIPMVIFKFIGVGLATSFIPIYNEINNDKGTQESSKFINILITTLLILTTMIIIIVLIFSDRIVVAFASGFEGKTLELAINFTRISIFGIYFVGIINIINAFLQLKGKYVISAISSLSLNIFYIITIILSFKINRIFLPLGSIIALLSQMTLVWFSAKKIGFVYKFSIDLKNKYLGQMIHIALPVIVGVSVDQINILVDRSLASNILVGGISSLNYANKLNLFVQGIFVTTIITVIYPMLSRSAIENNIRDFKRILAEAIGVINILVIPSTIGFIIFSNEIITIMFGRGAFDSRAISSTAIALLFYSLGMLGIGLREVLSRTFYSMKDAKTPMTNAALGMLVNIILNIILSRYLGIGGLALATSIAATFTTILLFISLRRKIGAFGMKQIIISFLKILFASSLMGIFAKLSFNYLTTFLSQNLSLLLAIGVGAASYFVIIYFMKIEDVDVIVGAIKKKLGNSKI